MSGMSEEKDIVTESDFADFLTETVFNPQAQESTPEPNLESQVAEPEATEEAPLPEPAFVETATEDEPALEEAEETVESEEEYVVWAKKQFGEDIDLSSETAQKLARSNYEKEKLLGKQSAQVERERQEREEMETKMRVEALSQRGDLNEEDMDWVAEAAESENPAAYAVSALENDRADLYAAILDRWSEQGGARQARDLHSRIVAHVSQPPPDPANEYAQALAQTFQSVGLSIPQHGDVIMAQAAKLGDGHRLVHAVMSHDPEVRALAVSQLWEMSQQGTVIVKKAQQDDQVEARLTEERLRANAAVVGNGTVHKAEQPKGGFWEEFDSEVAARGWDGARPGYKEQRD